MPAALPDSPERLYAPSEISPITPSNGGRLDSVAASTTDGLGLTFTALTAGTAGNSLTVDVVDSAGAAISVAAAGSDITVSAPIDGKAAVLILDAGAGEVVTTADVLGSASNGINVSLIKRVTIATLALSVEATGPRDFKVYLATDATTDVFATLSTALTGNNNDLDFTSLLEGAYGNLITIAYVAPTVANATTDVSVNDKAITVTLAGTIGTSTLTTALAGSNNDLTYTALLTGSVRGDDISITYVKPEANSAVLSCTVSSAGAVVVNLATNTDGVSQVETATCAGTVSGAGNAAVTVTAADITGSPIVLAVPVTAGAATAWAAEVRAYLQSNAAAAAIREKYDITGATTALIATANTKRANDGTLNIALATGTATGITTAATSANTTAGVATVTTTTAADIEALLEADLGFASIATVANAAANDGTGTVIAMAAANLAGGGDFTITSTAAQVEAAIEANRDAAALVSVANKAANDGTGVVTVLAATALASGAHANAVSTVAQVVTALNANATYAALATATGTGVTSTAINANYSGTLSGGIDGGSVTLGEIAGAINSDADSKDLIRAAIDPKNNDVQPTATAWAASTYPVTLEGGVAGQWDLTNGFARGLYATGEGDVVLYIGDPAGTREERTITVPNNAVLDISFTGIKSTGTTATGIFGRA